MTCRTTASWPTREEIERIRDAYDTYCATPDLTGAAQIAGKLGTVLRRVEWLELLLLHVVAHPSMDRRKA